MKHKKLFLLLFLISISLNITLSILYLYEKKEAQRIIDTWDRSINNVIFLYEQYLENDIEEAYYYANGEIATMVNIIHYIYDIDKDDFPKYFLGFYQCLVTQPIKMKKNMNRVIEIFELIQQDDYTAFYLIKEIVDEEFNLEDIMPDPSQ